VAPVAQINVHRVPAAMVLPAAVKITFAFALALAATVVVKVVCPQVPVDATGFVPSARIQ